MPTDHHYRRDPVCRAAVLALTAQFQGQVPEPVVARTGIAARHDLEDRIQPEALADMLHRLAQHRLDAMITTRT
ncbi:MAG: hypothetical protein HOV94_21120 [Saccharothrix sp.]|nr:hypothetical protein [Saccharothrix sp.]